MRLISRLVHGHKLAQLRRQLHLCRVRQLGVGIDRPGGQTLQSGVLQRVDDLVQSLIPQQVLEPKRSAGVDLQHIDNDLITVCRPHLLC